MSRLRAGLRWIWQHFLPRARITVRILTAVVLAMTVVLVATGAFVYWRISYALDRQLNEDLRAYSDAVTRVISGSGDLPSDDPGEVSQTYTTTGALLATSDPGTRRLLSIEQARNAGRIPHTFDLGRFIPAPTLTPYRVRYQTVSTPDGTIVLATAIARNKHDEALRELLGQVALADLATIIAAAVVGWGAIRAALGPVERYRRAAADAGGDPSARLPVDADRDDELTRLGNTLNELLGEIEAGQRRERQFLADASHELRSPLALLAAEVEWARHRPRTPAELDEVLSSVGDQTSRLVRLANALLDLEEANEGAPLAREPVHIDALISDATRPFRDAAAQQRRTIEVHTDGAVAAVEPHWVGLAVSNLIGNAIKHGQGTVSVESHVTGGVLQLVVRDQGEGIPVDLGDTAFERFARADQARTTPGNGLGLAIVEAVARRHGGSAARIPGGVRLELPLA